MNKDSEAFDGPLLIRALVVGPLNTNTYVVADTETRRGVVIDPGDEAQRVLDAITDIEAFAIVLTHSHWDHVLGVAELVDATGIPVLAHPDDHAIWPHELGHLAAHGHFDAGTMTDELLSCGCPPVPAEGSPTWDGTVTPLAHGDALALGPSTKIRVIHTPGHTPGGLTLVSDRHAFTGDTLFPGGPGLTGWPFSDFATIIDSIRDRLLTLPGSTIVHPGHGRQTTIAAERPHLHEWITRGW